MGGQHHGACRVFVDPLYKARWVFPGYLPQRKPNSEFVELMAKASPFGRTLLKNGALRLGEAFLGKFLAFTMDAEATTLGGSRGGGVRACIIETSETRSFDGSVNDNRLGRLPNDTFSTYFSTHKTFMLAQAAPD